MCQIVFLVEYLVLAYLRFSFPIDSDAATSCKEKDSIVGKKLQVGRYSGDKKGDD
nr:MAG TPA: hypothetical protein [Caudoviricetes sp.]